MSLSNPEIVLSGPGISSQAIKILPNTWKYNEGSPEKNVRAVVVGESVEQEFSENMESAFSVFSFSTAVTAAYNDLSRSAELAKNTLTVTATATEVVKGAEQTWRRVFKAASVDVSEKPFGADTSMEWAFKSDSAV